jgi:hypothetical protein
MQRHSGRLGGNNTATRIIEYLRTVPFATTAEIHGATGSMAASRDISNARALLNGTGEEIPPATFYGTIPGGSRVFVYRLTRREKVTA